MQAGFRFTDDDTEAQEDEAVHRESHCMHLAEPGLCHGSLSPCYSPHPQCEGMRRRRRGWGTPTLKIIFGLTFSKEVYVIDG